MKTINLPEFRSQTRVEAKETFREAEVSMEVTPMDGTIEIRITTIKIKKTFLQIE